MSILARTQRAVIVADQGIHPLIVDRCAEAFDALIDRRDVQEYKRLMGQAWSQMGFDLEHTIKPEDRPTALDRVKTICIRAYADREHIPPRRAATRLKQMLEG